MKKIHFKADRGEISRYVLMPGDPLRAEQFAQDFLEKPRLVSDVRNMLVYSGYYHDQFVTIAASGMGCPSIGIYSYELYHNYDVQAIIRVGTAGSYQAQLEPWSLINVISSYSESTYAQFAANYHENTIAATPKLVDLIRQTAAQQNLVITNGKIHTTDVFYHHDPQYWAKVAAEQQVVACEMESFALFANAYASQKNGGDYFNGFWFNCDRKLNYVRRTTKENASDGETRFR